MTNMLREVIYGFVTLLIGVAFLGPLNDMVATVAVNLTGFSSTIVGLITGFFALSLIAVGVGLIIKAFGPSMDGGY